MIPLYINIPEGCIWWNLKPGYQIIHLPSVPRIGEVIHDVNNKALKIKKVIYRIEPRPTDNQPHIELEVEITN